jgi:hypothetical protein
MIDIAFRTHWKGNYWGHPLEGPKVIVCYILIYSQNEYAPPKAIPYYNFDWFPAKEPYDIPEVK